MDNDTGKFNADELEAPSWMNDDFFLKVLKNCENQCKNLKLISKQISPASMKGDHYASIMFRALVKYELNGDGKSISLIIKTMPEVDGHKKEMLGESDIFEREISMYTEVLPRFEQILRAVGDNTVLKANCLYSALAPQKVIIFEDLLPLGYEVVRDRQPNEDEVKAVYAKLAKYHAISYKINLEVSGKYVDSKTTDFQEPHYFDIFQKGIFNMPGVEEQAFMTGGVKFFMGMLKRTPSLHKYIPHFESLQDTLLEKCRSLCAEYRVAPREGAYYVLCHGDFHEKNMMFKFEGETRKPADVMLIDYQMCFVSSITYDLIYSYYCLLDESLRPEFPALLYYYYTIFTDTLKKIGFKGEVPKLTKLREEFVRHKDIEIFLFVTFLPMWYAVRDSDFDVERLMTSEDYRSSMYSSDEYVKYVEKILPRYLHLGYLDD